MSVQKVVDGRAGGQRGVIGHLFGVPSIGGVEVDVDFQDPVLEGDGHVDVLDGGAVEPRENDVTRGLGGRLDDALVRDHSVAGTGAAGARRAAHAATAAEHVLELRLEFLELLLDALLLLFEGLDAELEALDLLF